MGKHVWTGRFKSLNVGVVEGEPQLLLHRAEDTGC